MLDIVGKVEFVHHDGDDGDHPGIDGGHMPGGITSLACPGHYVVGWSEAQCLDLKMVSHTSPPWNLRAQTSSGAVVEVRKFSTVSRAFTAALAIGSCKM